MMSNDEHNEDQFEEASSISSKEESMQEGDDVDSIEESSVAAEPPDGSDDVTLLEELEEEQVITLREDSIADVDDVDSIEEPGAAAERPDESDNEASPEELEDEHVITLMEDSLADEDGFDSLEELSAAAELPGDSDNETSPEEPEEEHIITLKEDDIADVDELDLIEGTSAAAKVSDGSDTVISSEEQEEEVITARREELKPVIEALLFVAEDPLPFKQICKLLGDVPEEDVEAALKELVSDYDAREGGLEIREIAGGWRISTRPQYHEFIRQYLKSRPSARLSLPALETLAVIAYKQPITAPEILEIRGVTSSSAIKTLLEKRLIVTRGRKETVGRPMLYGTSKEFLIQFGLKDLSELPSIEDFEDLAR
jgi:segregation and condensation protein B